jgi:hypothetical protein
MATRLKGLTVDRVDLVDIGANLDRRTGDGAHIMLYKRAPQEAPAPIAETPMQRLIAKAKSLQASADLIAKTEAVARSFDEVLAGRKAQQALDSLWDLYYAFMESARSIFESDEANKIGLLRVSAVDFMNAFLMALPEAAEDASDAAGVEKIGRKISGSRMKQLREMHEKLGSLLKEVEGDEAMKSVDLAKSLGVTLPDGATEEQAVEAIKKHNEALVAKAAEKPGADDVQKRIDAALLEERTKNTAELAKRDEAIAKANEVAKAERDARILKQFDEQARTEFSGLSLTLQKAADKPEAKTDAEIFKAVSEKAPEEWLRIESILKGAAEAIRTSKLFEEQGANGPQGAAGSALEQINAKADEMVAKNLAPTREQAIAKLATDPQHAELMARYSDEQRGKK